MSDIHVTAPCGCFLTDFHGRANIATCHEHSASLRMIFDGNPDDVGDVLTAAFTA